MADEQERARILAQFERKKQGAAPASADGEEDDGSYRAFKATDRKPPSLAVLPVSQAQEWISYQYLLRIVLEPRGRRLALIFTFMALVLKGKNLRQVAEAISDRRCDWIQEFDEKQWTRPTDPDTAFIEAIEFVVDAAPMSAADMAKDEAA